MKVCPKCQTGNSDEMVLCRDCGAFLGAVLAQEGDTLFKKEMGEYERKQRRNKNLALLGVFLAGALNVLFLIVSIVRGTFLFPEILILFTPVVGYFAVFRSEALFKFSHFNDFYNIDDIRPTDWYYFKNMIGGILMIVMGTVMMGFIALH